MSTAEELLFGKNNKKPMFDDRTQIKSWIQNRLIPLGILIVIERSDDSKIVFKCKSYRYSSGFKKIRQKRVSKKQKLLWKEKGLVHLEESLKKIKDNQNNNATSCPFRIRANFSVRVNKWTIVILNHEHNHPLRNCLNEKGETFNDNSFTKDIGYNLERNRFFLNPAEPQMISNEQYEKIYEKKPQVLPNILSFGYNTSEEDEDLETFFKRDVSNASNNIDTLQRNVRITESPFLKPEHSSPPVIKVKSKSNNNTLNNGNDCTNCANCDCDMSSYESISPPIAGFLNDHLEFDSAFEATASKEYTRHRQEMIDINRLLDENNTIASVKPETSTPSLLSFDRDSTNTQTVSNARSNVTYEKDINPPFCFNNDFLKVCDFEVTNFTPAYSNIDSFCNDKNLSEITINENTFTDILNLNMNFELYEEL